MTTYPLYLWHHIYYIWKHNTVCFWYHSRHMRDIICTKDDITSTLSQETVVFMMSHPLQAWHHTHCIRHHTHCIFVMKTSPLLSYPLLYDIIPTLCVTSYALYITSYQLLMSSHYCTWHYMCDHIWNHIQYVGPHTQYTCDITATNLCHHSHSIDNITHTL